MVPKESEDAMATGVRPSRRTKWILAAALYVAIVAVYGVLAQFMAFSVCRAYEMAAWRVDHTLDLQVVLATVAACVAVATAAELFCRSKRFDMFLAGMAVCVLTVLAWLVVHNWLFAGSTCVTGGIRVVYELSIPVAGTLVWLALRPEGWHLGN